MKTPDLGRRYLGAPCYKGHDGWRYRRGGGCCTCHRLRVNDRAQLKKEQRYDSAPQRRDEFRAAIDAAAELMYRAGQKLWEAKDMRMHGWRQELTRHGLTQKTAAELRRYAYKRDTGSEFKTKRQMQEAADKAVENLGADDPVEWLDE